MLPTLRHSLLGLLLGGTMLLGVTGCPGDDQGDDAGYATIVGGDGLSSPDYIGVAAGAAESSYVITPFIVDKALPGGAEFAGAFEKRFGEAPDAWAALTYDAVGTIATVIREVGADRAKIRDGLAAMKDEATGYWGVTGLTFFDANGDCPSKPAIVSVIRGGVQVKADKQPANPNLKPPEQWAGKGKATGEPITIGVAGPFTGSSQKFGEMIRSGALLKQQEINERGGINGRPLHIVWGDDEAVNSKAVNVANEFVANKKLVAVVGHFNSTCSLAGKPVYKNNGVPAISPGSTNVKVCEGSDFMFRNLYRDDFQGGFAATFVKETLKAKKVVVFFDNDDYGNGLKNAFMAKAKELGLEVAEPIPYNRDSTIDFAANVTTAKYQRPDVIFIAGTYNEGALIAKACKKAGLTK